MSSENISDKLSSTLINSFLKFRETMTFAAKIRNVIEAKLKTTPKNYNN